MNQPPNRRRCRYAADGPPPDDERSLLESVVSHLAAPAPDSAGLVRLRTPCRQPLPARAALAAIVEELRSVLFPGYFGRAELTAASLPFHVGATLDGIQRELHEQVLRGLCFACLDESDACNLCQERARKTTLAFIGRLPEVRGLLICDVQAAFEGDPAAGSPEETIFCYPGLQAVMSYRIAHLLHELGVPLLPRIITELAHGSTGIDIHPGAEIGESFFIDHGTGVVIGETCVIGDRVRIYQGVTLGAKSFPVDEQGKPVKGVPRHPIVEDDVIIYSGATILGRVTIGRGSVIGGNVWLTQDVPPGSRVTQRQPRLVVLEGPDEGGAEED